MRDALLPWAQWLEQTGLGTSLRQSSWAYPAVEVGHLLGLGLLVGTAVAFDVRLLGLHARLPVSLLAAYLLPLARLGFGVAAITGVLLVIANATTLLTGVFALKLAAIGLALANATWFHASVFRSVSAWDVESKVPGAARRTAVVSMLCWALAVACGRLLAYI